MIAWRLTLSLAVGSIFFCAWQQTRPAERAGQKMFSSVSSPIIACRVFTSITGSGSAFAASPKTPVAP